jgi:imidazolonepropionase-like amidohydrolase
VWVDLGGSDKRQHAEGELTTQFRVSGDGMWLAFIENYEVFITPMLKTGHSVAIGPKSKTARTVRVSASGGNYLNWTDGDTLTYSLGPELFTVRTDDIFREEFKPPDSSRGIDVTRPADTPTGSLALVGATVITMNADRQVIEDGVILITGKRITSVGKRGDIDIPGDSQQVDVTGKAITPGFIDAHAHGAYGTRGIIPQQSWVQYATLAFGVTTVHDPSSRSTHVFAASDYQRAGVVLAPRIFSTGEIVYGAKGDLWAPVESLDDAVRHLQRLKAQGAYSVKNYNQPRRDQRQQVIQAARQLGMNVYAEGAALFHLDMSLIVDGNTGLEHTLPNQAVYEDVLEFWPQTRVGYTPTLVVGYGAVSGEDYWYQHTRVWKHPLLTRFVPPHVLQPRSVRRQMSPDADYAHFAIGRIGKQLADRGVSVHTGAHGQREGLATHWEMWMFVQAGMSPMQALQAATISPAGYLGYDHDLGSIETGKLADLVIMNSNPLSDIRNSEDLDKVMLNGRLYDVRSLDEEITGSRKTREFYWWE